MTTTYGFYRFYLYLYDNLTTLYSDITKKYYRNYKISEIMYGGKKL